MLKKLWEVEWIRYSAIGGATTALNFVTHFLCRFFLRFDVNMAVIISWTIAVLFSFIANKQFVFMKSGSSSQVVRAFFLFVVARIASLGIELFLMIILFSEIGLNEIVAKLLTQVIIIVSNYLFSKWIFK